MKTIYINILSILLLLPVSIQAQKQNIHAETSFRVNPSNRQQTMEGWGVSLCWWANMCGKWTDDKVDRLIDLLTSPDGLNYNIFRYNIGGGDNPSHLNGHMTKGKGKRAEMEGFKASQKAAYNWSADAGQRNILLRIQKARPDAVYEAFSNSAPYWMTYSGCSAGNSNSSRDNLKPEYYGMFCDYLIDVCRHYRDKYGIEFKTLEPFNEPNTNYWGADGGQEGCHFSPETQADLLRILFPKMKASGLKTVISASDETSVSTAIKGLNTFLKEGDIIPMLGQFNVHTYEGNPLDKANLREIVRETGLPFWMSETGAGGKGIAGNLSLAQRMFDDLNYMMPQAWIDWQFVEEGNDQWCMVRGNFDAQTYTIVKNYYVRMQVTRFIKQGYTILTTSRHDVLAAISPDSREIILVMLNTSDSAKRMTADLSLLKGIDEKAVLYVTNSRLDCKRQNDIVIKDKTLTYSMGGYEIATAIIKAEGADSIPVLTEGVPHLIVARASSAVMKYDQKGPVLADLNVNDAAQMWYFKHVSDGRYIVYSETEGQRKALTDNGTYYLEFSESDESNLSQLFYINTAGDNSYRLISCSNSKLLDLEGNSTSTGTRVGVWKTGAAGENGHREWRIFLAPFCGLTSEGTSVFNSKTGSLPVPYSCHGQICLYNPGAKEVSMKVYNSCGSLKASIHDTTKRMIYLDVLPGIYIIRYSMDGIFHSSKIIVE